MHVFVYYFLQVNNYLYKTIVASTACLNQDILNMKFNERELAELSFAPATIEGRLNHKKQRGNLSQSGFKEKWFKLRANVLFYFHVNESGQIIDKKPAGAYVIENAIIQYEMPSEISFSFSIIFHDDIEKKHLFGARSEAKVNHWVSCLKESSCQYWKGQLLMLKSKLALLAGNDPRLVLPPPLPVSPLSKRIGTRSKATKQSSFQSYITPQQTVASTCLTSSCASDEALATNIQQLQLPPPPVRPPRSRPVISRPAPAPPSITNNLIDL